MARTSAIGASAIRPPKPYHKGIDWDAVLAAAVAAGTCQKDLARQLGVARYAVASACQVRGIVLVRKHASYPKLVDADVLHALENGESFNGFCLRMGIQAGALYGAEKRLRVRLRRRGPRTAA